MKTTYVKVIRDFDDSNSKHLYTYFTIKIYRSNKDSIHFIKDQIDRNDFEEYIGVYKKWISNVIENPYKYLKDHDALLLAKWVIKESLEGSEVKFLDAYT